MKKSRHKFSFILLMVLLTFSLSFSKDDALKQKLLERVKSFYGVESLSPRQQTGFMYQMTLREIYNQLSPELQKVADTQINVQGPSRQMTIQSPSTKFTLHYDTTNTDSTFNAVPLEDISGNGVPDYIDSAAVFLDYVWQVSVNEIGFLPPLNENGNPVSSYDIYFTSQPFYGQTFTINPINDDNPNTIFNEDHPDNYTSYIELNNTMQSSGINTKGLDGLRVTCAHEFHHAIQLSYRWWPSDRFFLEMTGTWNEDIIYPDVNDYFFYLDGFFRRAQSIRFTSLNGNDPYANGLYLHMLSQIYGNSIVVEIWEQIIYKKALDALETVLQRYGSSFSQSLNTYAKWLYFTGERTIPGEFFTDASSFEMITIPERAMLKSDIVVKHNFEISRESFYYFKLDSVFTLAGRGDVDTEINNDEIQVNYFNSEKFYSNPAQAGVRQPILIESTPQDLVFAVSNARDSAVSVSFTFVSDSTIVPRDKGSKVAYGPNPTNIAAGVKSANFWAVPAFAKIIIMDLNQQPVRSLQNDEFFDTPVTWDLKDKNGKTVSSGIYFYIVTGQGKTQLNKIAIIR